MDEESEVIPVYGVIRVYTETLDKLRFISAVRSRTMIKILESFIDAEYEKELFKIANPPAPPEPESIELEGLF